MKDEDYYRSVAPLVAVRDRRYVETLECGHTIDWQRPGAGTGGHRWPRLAEKRRCLVCALAQPRVDGPTETEVTT